MYNKYIDKLVSSQYLSKKIVLLIDVIMSVVSSGVALGILFFIRSITLSFNTVAIWLLSATMSSASSDAIAGVGVLVQDIYPMITGKELSSKAAGYVSRLLTIMTLVLAFIACLFAKDVMSYITNVIGSIIPGVSVAMVFGALYKKASWQSGVAAIVSGLLFGVSFLAIDSFNAYIKEVFSGPAIPATIVAVVCALVVALVTGKEKLSEQERLNIVYASRGKSHE